MRIHGSSFDPLRPDRVNPGGQAESRPAEKGPGEPGGNSPAPARAKTDSVQISDAGRSLAQRLGTEQHDTFSAERVDELRSKVLSGAYNSLDVVDQVARRILSRGEL